MSSNAFYKAYNWLYHHPAFYHIKLNPRSKKEYRFPGFMDTLTIDVYKLDPKTKDYQSTPNARGITWVSLEAGPYVDLRKEPIYKAGEWEPGMNYEGQSHDWQLDCGAETFEKAIIKLARKVKKKYGDYDHEED